MSFVIFVLELLVVIGIPVGLGFWASSIAKKKDRSAGGFFALGFFLPVIGVIIAAVVSPGQALGRNLAGAKPGSHAAAARGHARSHGVPLWDKWIG